MTEADRERLAAIKQMAPWRGGYCLNEIEWLIAALEQAWGELDICQSSQVRHGRPAPKETPDGNDKG